MAKSKTDAPAKAAEQVAIPMAETTLPARTVPPTEAIFAVIERASLNPAVDIDKMERLITMHERMQARQAQIEYDNAMQQAQQSMERVRADATNPSTKSKYASYGALDRAVRPNYTNAGFSLSFDTGEGAPPDHIRILCRVSHRSGHRETHHIDMPADGKGAKGGDVMTKTHAAGSAVTYGKRYILQMVFNIAIGEDDDGNAAGGQSAGKKAKAYVDNTIEWLNLGKHTDDSLAKMRSENEKQIAWLKRNAPDQYERFWTAYTNVAESIGLKEPKRDDPKYQSQPDASPHGAPAEGGQAGQTPPAGAGGDSKSEADSAPATSKANAPKKKEQSVNVTKPAAGVTDVVDENAQPIEDGVAPEDPATWPPEWAKPGEQLEFSRYAKLTEFTKFADPFLAATNADGAAQFEHFYNGTLVAMEHEKATDKMKAAATQYRATLAAFRASGREPGEEG